MLKKSIFLSLIVLLAVGCTDLQKVAGKLALGMEPTTAEIIGALKEALNIGIGKGADALSKQDGFFKSPYKILLPAEAQKVTDKLKGIPGFAQVENTILEKINRGAEDAAIKAKPIFIDAIKKMTITDAKNILLGQNNAATGYLKKTTYDQLYTAFKPTITSSLNKFNALKYWEDAVNAYNAIPFVQKMNPKLDDYVTQQALNGLFKKIEQEELAIRTNKANRTTELLRKVFAQQD
jgi:hypothetical protein